MRERIFMLMALCACSLAVAGAQGRHALLVGVGDYPPESGWTKIHAGNDLRVVRAALLDAGFAASDIVELRDAEATCRGIRSAFHRLTSSLSAGDEVLILFSCHGQQVEDREGDETDDGLDEALVPYDACIRYGWNGYKGDKHLLDDELNRLLWRIRKKIGGDGHLLVLLDTCHSGDADRGDQEEDREMVRGTREVLSGVKRSRSRGVPLPRDWHCISACRNWQDNVEYAVDGTVYGRLAYTFSQCYRKGIGDDELARKMAEMYASFPPTRGGWRQELDFHVD